MVTDQGELRYALLPTPPDIAAPADWLESAQPCTGRNSNDLSAGTALRGERG